MKSKALLILVVFTFVAGCSSLHKSIAEQETALKAMAVQKYGAAFELLFNNSKDFAIVVKQKKSSSLDPNPPLAFFVYNMKESKIIFEDSPGKATVIWKNNNQVEVRLVLGTISTENEENNYGYYFDVLKEVKSNINSSTKVKNQ